jgi:alpha-beta hydrolase superfamily lysophospholipase
MKFITAETLNSDSIKIFISESDLPDTPKGVIHIYHGLAEYFGRYTHTTKYLNSLGYHVVGIDHRGHGHWIESGAVPGFFAEKDGWNLVVDDMETSFKKIQTVYEDIPHIILAHSMGTWLTLALLQRDISPSKVILSASSKLSVTKLMLQKLIIKIIKFFKGPKSQSHFSDLLTTQQFNSQFKPNRTTHDWLSSNHESVDAYINNPLCGFIPTNQLYEDLADGVIESFSHKKMLSIDKNLSILLIAGTQDPVGESGRGVEALHKFLGKYNKSLKLVLLPELRHEILNEIKKEQALSKISEFLNS